MRIGFLILICAIPLKAATYYVATNGLDANPGTISQPWLTGVKASSVVSAGDTVYFRGGSYTNQWLSGTGTLPSPINFAAYPNEKPMISADNTTNATVYGISVSGAFITLDGFTVYGGYAGIRAVTVPNCIVQNCDVSGTAFAGIDVGIYSSNSIVRNCRVWNADVLNVPRSHDGHGLGWGGGITIHGGSHNSLIENCIAYLVNGEDILVAACNGCTIQNCISADNYKTAFYIDGGNNRCLNNICWQTYSNSVLNAPVYGQPTYTLSADVTTEGQELYPPAYHVNGLRGTAVYNNLFINGSIEQDFYAQPTNYLMSDELFLNNTIINADFGLLSDPTSLLSSNYVVVNNLLLSTIFGGGPIVLNGTNFMDWGNNVHVFDGSKSSYSLSWNGVGGNYFFGFLTGWMVGSGETNTGPHASVWNPDTNFCNSVIPGLSTKVAAMPRLWNTNGFTAVAPADLDISWVFTNLATCSNNIQILRQQLAAPFRPAISASNPALTTSRAFPSWTWHDDSGSSKSISAPIGTDLMGNARSSSNPTVGALEPGRNLFFTAGHL